jgi:hypothetical protein
MDGFDLNVVYRRSGFKIGSAASEVGKSMYLYLVAVFARHFETPVWFVASTTSLLEGLPDKGTVVVNTQQCCCYERKDFE